MAPVGSSFPTLGLPSGFNTLNSGSASSSAGTLTPLTFIPLTSTGSGNPGAVSTPFGDTLSLDTLKNSIFGPVLTSSPTVSNTTPAAGSKTALPPTSTAPTTNPVGDDIVDQVAKMLGLGTQGNTANVVTIAPTQTTTNTYTNTSNADTGKVLDAFNIFTSNQANAQILENQQNAGFWSRMLSSMDNLITKVTSTSPAPLRGDDGTLLGTMARPGTWGYAQLTDQAMPVTAGTPAATIQSDAQVSTIGGVKFNWAMIGALAAALSVLVYLARRK